MLVTKAQELGFCFGVRRAIGLLEQAVKDLGKVEAIGDIVHNQQVMEHLSEIGVTTISGLEEIQSNVIAIPSHGLSKHTVDEMYARKLNVIDTTCPKVRKAQMIAEELARADFEVIIFGDADHAEVKSVLSHAGSKSMAIQNHIETHQLNKPIKGLGILSQTTQNPDNFSRFANQLVSTYMSTIGEIRILNTICTATKKRQDAALKLAQKVDLMIVIGGYDSANTQRLAEICASSGVKTHHIETAQDIEDSWLQVKRIGLTAGASTPDKAIIDVQRILEEHLAP